MSQSLLITNLMYNRTDYIAAALYEEQKLTEVICEKKNEKSILGNIYVGRVKDVVKNLNAAFIEIAPGLACYYSLEEYENPVFVKKINSPRLVPGDELLVQVVKESMKTKPPRVTTNLNLSGKYLALTTGNTKLGTSKKLESQRRKHLKELIGPLKDPRFGLVVRTNCGQADDEQIRTELFRLQEQASELTAKAPYRTCFSCLLQQRPEYVSCLQNVYTEDLKQIVTDDPVLFEQIQEYLKEQQPNDLPLLRFYEDSLLSLSRLYGLETGIGDALKERVWLKSGGYLVIQPTEALTVVDVNTGKSTARKTAQEHYRNINLEAAEETARQLRLRNISGIIIIDFIDLKSDEEKEHLVEELKRFVRKDPVPVQVLGMTRLNLVEVTRKKVRRSLREQLT